MRHALTSAVVALAVAGIATATVSAGEPPTPTPPSTSAPIPLPDRLYVGSITYRRRQPITIKTSKDGRRVKVAPGYYNLFTNCGALGGEMYTAFIPSKQWLPVRGRRFAGTGRGYYWTDNDTQQAYTWTISGRFTSTPAVAVGRITIRGVLRRDGHDWLTCQPITTTWRTHRTAALSDWWNF